MQSERIQLIRPSLSLVPEVLLALEESQTELEEYLPWVQATFDDPVGNMEAAINNHTKFANELRYYVVEKKNQSIAGCIGLIIRDAVVPFYEIGYWARTSHAGKGYISEALSLIESYAFDGLNALRLEIRMAENNLRSRAVAERAGYELEAILKNERRLPDGTLSGTLVFAKFAS